MLCALGLHEWEFVHDFHKIFSKEYRVCSRCNKRQADLNFERLCNNPPRWVSVRHERYPEGYHDRYIKGK